MSAVAVGARVRLTVPASTANLGSGFDALGMALALHDVVEVEVTDSPPGSARVDVEGVGAGAVPVDADHLVVRALHRAWDDLDIEASAVRLRCYNSIPHSRGLGSSGAAIVAGVTAAYELAGFSLRDKENADRALHVAGSMEGHADNVAASMFGGVVIVWNEDGRFHAVSMPPHASVAPVLLVPPQESATNVTRGLIPEQVPHADAAFAAGRTALAIHALTSAPELLLAATADRLHQDYRESAWPRTVALVRRLRSSGVAAAVSGAGPAVLALPVGAVPESVDLDGFSARALEVDRCGVRVEGSQR